MLTTTLATD